MTKTTEVHHMLTNGHVQCRKCGMGIPSTTIPIDQCVACAQKEWEQKNHPGETVVFPFRRHQHVRFKAVAIDGVVTGMAYSINGFEIEVVYWSNGDRHKVYAYAEELEAV